MILHALPLREEKFLKMIENEMHAQLLSTLGSDATEFLALTSQGRAGIIPQISILVAHERSIRAQLQTLQHQLDFLLSKKQSCYDELQKHSKNDEF